MAFLFFVAVFTLLGWLACEHDVFPFVSSVPAASPHTAPPSPSSSSSPSAPAGPAATPSLPRRERRALARSRSRSPPPVPAWARPGSLLSPPRHRPAEGKYDTFLDVRSTEAFGQMERVWDPVCGWRWAAVRGERLAARMIPLPNSPPPSPVVVASPPPPPPVVVLPSPVAASAPVVVSAPPAPAVVPPPRRSVASILAGIPSQPQGLTHVFPVPAPAPQPQPQPLFGGLSLATPANYASGSLAMVLPYFTTSVSTPLASPPPPVLAPPPPPSPVSLPQTSLPAGADHKPQADEKSAFVAPPPPPPSSSFAFGGGFGGAFAAPAPAPSFGGGFDAFGGTFDFSTPSSFSSAAPSSSAPRRRGDRRGNIIHRRVEDVRIEDDREDGTSLRETHDDAGLNTYDLVMNADLAFLSTCGLEKIDEYISGSSLASFETNLRSKENGLRCFANLLRWQYGTSRPQPPGGTPALGQLITVLARVDGLVTGFVADKRGRQQQFVEGDFLAWARAWRYLEKYGWLSHRERLQRDLDPAVFGRLEELVRRNQAHWVRFLRPDEGRDW